MSHVLFVTPYYPPERGAPMVRISETAKVLISQGYEVTVLTTFPNHPTGIVPVEYRGHFILKEVIDEVRIIRIWSYFSSNKGFTRRVLAHLSFGCLAPLLGGKAVGQPDVIIVESPPLFNAIAGHLLSWSKRCPFIFTVADLWPESAIQLGMLRNRIFIRMAEWLEWSTYQHAGAIWAVTEGIYTTLIRRGLSPEYVFLLTNGVDTTLFNPRSQAQARAELGWNEQFIVLYAGTHGISHALVTLLDAAEQLQGFPDIRFILIGEGAEKEHLIAEAERRKLPNVTFMEPQPHERMPLFLAAADACVMHMRKIPLFKGALPFKMFEAMAMARPILLGVDGEARRIAVQEAQAALYVEPENAAELASAVLYVHDHPEEAELLGQRARTLVKQRFDRVQLTKTLEGHIARLLKKEAAITESPLSGILVEER
jgi:glycosyltransferase involved in cell wall biosynthesis